MNIATRSHYLTPQFLLSSVIALAFAMGVLGLAMITEAGPNGRNGTTGPQRFIVVLDDDPAVNERAREALDGKGGQELKDLSIINGFVVLLPDQAAAEELVALEGVRYVEPDIMVHTIHHRPGHDGGPPPKNGDDDPDDPDEPDDPSGPPQVVDWGVERIGAPGVWDHSTGNGVRVSVVDTGIALDHPDLTVVHGADCTRGPNCDRGGNKGDDDHGHGTHVAGTIAALDNEIGVVGVAHSADLLSAKVLNNQGSGFLSDVIAGIEWSVNNGAQVINMSLGTTTRNQSLEDAVDAAYGDGVVLVAAAGNNGHLSNDPMYPAAYDSVIAVGATNDDDNRASFSNTGSYVELLAPGMDILSTWINDDYRTASGTSMASPHVAGVAALVFGFGEYTNTEVRDIMRDFAEDIALHADLVSATGIFTELIE